MGQYLISIDDYIIFLSFQFLSIICQNSFLDGSFTYLITYSRIKEDSLSVPLYIKCIYELNFIFEFFFRAFSYERANTCFMTLRGGLNSQHVYY